MAAQPAFYTSDDLDKDMSLITNPFYYMPITNDDLQSECTPQDQIEVARKTEGENKLLAKIGKQKKLTKTNSSKQSSIIKKTSLEFPLVSYIKKKIVRGHRLIKIDVYDINAFSYLKNSEMDDGADNIISVQYVIENDFDEIMSLTENVIGKITKKLSVNETIL